METDLLSQLRIMMKEELEPIRTDIKSVNNKVDKIAGKIDITYDQVVRTA